MIVYDYNYIIIHIILESISGKQTFKTVKEKNNPSNTFTSITRKSGKVVLKHTLK